MRYANVTNLSLFFPILKNRNNLINIDKAMHLHEIDFIVSDP